MYSRVYFVCGQAGLCPETKNGVDDVAKITNKRLKLVLLVAILLGLIASLTVACQRIKGESEANKTLLTLEWNQLKDTAFRQGLTVSEAVKYLQDYKGKDLLNGVVFKEPALNDLQNSGVLKVMSGYEVSQELDTKSWSIVKEGTVEAARKINQNYNYVITAEKSVQQEIYSNLAIKTYSTVYMIQFKAGNTTIYGVATSMPYTDLVNLGTGFPRLDLETIHKNNLQAVVQVRSWPKVDQASIDFVFNGLKEYGVVAAGFNDPDLPGVIQKDWPEISKLLAEKFKSEGWPLLSAEFFSQKGLSAVASKMNYNVVRMHPISEAELAKYSENQIVERFQLATSERNMGIALVRVYSKLSLEDNAAYLNDIATAITDKGKELGGMGVSPDMQPKAWVLILVSLAVAAAAVPLCARLNFKQWSIIVPALAFLVAVALVVLGKAGFAQKLIALGAAIVYPTLGVMLFASDRPQKLLSAIASLLAMSLVSLMGALLVVGTLSTTNYMTGTAVFAGVKVAQFIPLVLMAVYFIYRAFIHNTNETILTVSKDIVKRPVSIGLLCLGLVALVILAMFMMRSGNDAVTVSDLERSFRSFLDQLLVVRPRTKEFMFAHPLMLLVLYYGYNKKLWPLVILGGIGQVSLVNTFAHLHTPIWVSLWRTANGLILGILLGLVLIVVVRYIEKLVEKHRRQPLRSTNF